MAARKRKSPERRSARKEPGVLAQAIAALSNTVATYPVITGGTVAFCVVFSFVAANALWYQHGGHPSPYLRTRDAANPTALIGFSQNSNPRIPAEDVTTFRIEREAPPAQPAAATPVQEAAATPPTTGAQAVLVQQIQQELARRGLYDGKSDGVMGPRTAAAILFFEESVGMEQTGEPTTRLLAALRIDAATVAAIPAERPSGQPAPSPAAPARPPVAPAAQARPPVPPKPAPQQAAIRPDKPSADPVADLIRAPSGSASMPVPPAPLPAAGAAAHPAVSNDVVMQIQRGLINIAYTDVTADGVVGARTRAAIRQFEKHYRLPETGEPSEAVLKKLKSIGAL